MDKAYPFGSMEWIKMVGEEISRSMARNPPASGQRMSFIECYHGGQPLSDELLPGFRVDIDGPSLRFRPGARSDEEADVRLDADIGAVKILSSLYMDDPEFNRSFEEFVSAGKVKVKGDMGALSPWMDGVHDAVTRRTL